MQEQDVGMAMELEDHGTRCTYVSVPGTRTHSTRVTPTVVHTVDCTREHVQQKMSRFCRHSRAKQDITDLKHSLATSQTAANKVVKQYHGECDKSRAATLAAADAQAQSARLQKEQQHTHGEITALRHSLAESQSALDSLKEEQQAKVGVHVSAFWQKALAVQSLFP